LTQEKQDSHEERQADGPAGDALLEAPRRARWAWKVGAVVALLAAVGLAVALKSGGGGSQEQLDDYGPSASGLPRLIEIGSVTCIPCKMMKPILDELRQEYAGRLQVDFIDVQVDPEAAGTYGIRVIPTQIFLDAGGKELFRHEGFFPKEDILAKWEEVGIDLSAPPEMEAPQPSRTGSKGDS